MHQREDAFDALRRRQWAMAVLMASGALLAGCSGPAPAKSAAAPATSGAAPSMSPSFKVVGSSRQIMLAITIPASETVFNAAAETPTIDEQWVSVERAALTLAESGNLLLIPGRAVDEGEWSRFSHMLIDTAALAYAAAQAKDIDGVSEAGNAIYEACEGCHKKYLPQPSRSR